MAHERAAYEQAAYEQAAYDEQAAYEQAAYENAAYEHAAYDVQAPYENAAYDEQAPYEHAPYDEQEATRTGWQRIFDWFRHDRDEWLNDMRGSLGLIASIIATITFQSALNPPGGVLQAGLSDKSNLLDCSIPNSLDLLCAGEAVLSLNKRDYYTFFLIFNSSCFIASLFVCLLLVSGLSLRNRVMMWPLSIFMCITVTSFMFAYLMGVFLVTPDAITSGGGIFNSWFRRLIYFFVVVFLLVCSHLAVRFLIWVVKKCHQRCNRG